MSAASSTLPFFGRAYELSITTASGTTIVVSSDAWEPEALRFTFDIETYAFKAFWVAEIAIYNCDGNISSGPSAGVNLAQTIISEGDQVIVKAGYQHGSYDTIFAGTVFQPIWERLDVVDYRLVLRCVLGRSLATLNFINDSVGALSTARQQALAIAQRSVTPINLDTEQLSVLPGIQLPRGKVFFGDPVRALHGLASQTGLLSWLNHTGWTVADPNTPLGDVIAKYAPPLSDQCAGSTNDAGETLSLIGTPQQTQYGVNFRVLLDPRVQVTAPLSQVGLNAQYVRQAQLSYPAPQAPPRPLQQTYGVVGVRYVGDTRGNAWYSEITGFSSVQDLLSLFGSPTSN